MACAGFFNELSVEAGSVVGGGFSACAGEEMESETALKGLLPFSALRWECKKLFTIAPVLTRTIHHPPPKSSFLHSSKAGASRLSMRHILTYSMCLYFNYTNATPYGKTVLGREFWSIHRLVKVIERERSRSLHI